MVDTRRIAALVAVAIPLTACGAQVADELGARTVTVPRCAEGVEYTTPKRAVAYEGGSADKLFALGLTDHVHGYVMPPANPPVEESPWAAEYAKVEFLGDDLLNKELVVEAEADLVVAGWRSGFSDERGITPEILDGLGIQSCMHTESCYNYPNHPEKVTPFEALYTDLERLGRIFGVEDRARKVVADLKTSPKTAGLPAVVNDRFHILDYNEGISGPRTVDGLEGFAEYLGSP